MHMIHRGHRKHLDKKLIRQLRIYFAISIILLVIVAYEIFTARVTLTFAAIGLLVGTVLGVVTARMYLVSWDKDVKKVIYRLDLIGGIILALYIVFAVFRGWVIGHFVTQNYVTGTGLAIVAGMMIGRVFGTGHKIGKILKEQGLF